MIEGIDLNPNLGNTMVQRLKFRLAPHRFWQRLKVPKHVRGFIPLFVRKAIKPLLNVFPKIWSPVAVELPNYLLSVDHITKRAYIKNSIVGCVLPISMWM